MRKSKFTESQIVAILAEGDAGLPVAEVWLTDYNEYRPHESLGNMPPAMFKPRLFQSKISTFTL